MTYIIILLLSAQLLYILILWLMYKQQRRIMYLPEADVARPKEYGLTEIEDDIIVTKDGVSLGCWFKPPRTKSKPLIVYYHGNAGHLGHRVEKLAAFIKEGYGICAPSYRSYGKSDGVPSEQGLYHDARAAMELVAKKGYKEKNIILYGESLGSGIAVQMALEYPNVKHLILEAPYTSTADRGIERYPWLPIYLLMKDQFDSLSKISRITCPLLVIHGEDDDIIPIHHGRTLLAAAKKPKKGIFLKNTDHTNFDPEALCGYIKEAVQKGK